MDKIITIVSFFLTSVTASVVIARQLLTDSVNLGVIVVVVLVSFAVGCVLITFLGSLIPSRR